MPRILREEGEEGEERMARMVARPVLGEAGTTVICILSVLVGDGVEEASFEDDNFGLSDEMCVDK